LGARAGADRKKADTEKLVSVGGNDAVPDE
jgi:hypothetical protein